jgi:hypothetical protein
MSVCDGDELWLLVLPRERAGDAHDVLLEVGRADGAVSVGLAAVELYRAAQHAGTPRSDANTLQFLIDSSTSGAAVS